MDTKELAELLLASMYYETETMGHINFIFSLHDVAAKLGAAEMPNLKDAAFYLESRGFALLSADISGGFGVIITDNGCAFIDQGGETGIAREYKEYLDRMEKMPANMNPANMISPEIPSAGTMQDHGIQFEDDLPVVQATTAGNIPKDLILHIMHTLITDDSLDSRTREDLLRDVDTLYIQLSKNTRNGRLIDALIATLSGIPSIAPLINRLSSMVHSS